MTKTQKNWAEEMMSDPKQREAFADFVAFLMDDPENGRTSPFPDRPTGTGIPLAKIVADKARKQRRKP